MLIKRKTCICGQAFSNTVLFKHKVKINYLNLNKSYVYNLKRKHGRAKIGRAKCACHLYGNLKVATWHFSKNLMACFWVGLLSVGFSFLKFSGPTIRWAYYPVGLLTGFYGIFFFKFYRILYKIFGNFQNWSTFGQKVHLACFSSCDLETFV